MLMMRSFAATAVASESARPVTVVIAMPVEKAMPFDISTFAPEVGGITSVMKMLAPAVGVPDVL